MRFGGHETFPIREGWLHRGLQLLTAEPDRLVEEHAADWLGVGRNMAKAIRYWLVATGLGDRTLLASTKQKGLLPPEATELGHLVWKRDPYLLEPGTWWALHINLANNPEFAYSWNWFFNRFASPRFERSVCVESLIRKLQLSRQRVPSHKTLQRDVGCLLASYAQPIPAERVDPEDASECPFRELGLLQHFRTSGTYRCNQGQKDIPAELFGFAIARALPRTATTADRTDVTLREAALEGNGPGKVFLLGEEGIFDLVTRFDNEPNSLVRVAGLAGERLVQLRSYSYLEWLAAYYERVGAGAENAA